MMAANSADQEQRVELESAAKGGLWSDQNLDQSLDWKGEEAAAQQQQDTAQRTAKITKKQERKELLKENNISTEVLRAISDTVAERIMLSSGLQGSNLKQSIDSIMQAKEREIRDWVTKTNAEAELTTPEIDTSEIAALKDKVATLDQKFEELLVAMSGRNTVELDIVRQAAQIITDNQRADAESGKTPSEVGRMEATVDDLQIRAQRLESLQAATAAARAGGHPVNLAKKRKNLKKL